MLSKRLLEIANQKSDLLEMSYYAARRAQEVGAENVFDFSVGNPSVEPPDSFKNSVKKLLDTKDSLALHGYAHGNGILSARQAVADSLNRRFGTDFSFHNIFMAIGAAGGVQLCLRAVTDFGQGDEVIVFAPYFPEYALYAEGAGVKLVVVPPNTETFQINEAAFEAMVTPRTRAVLINTPNNPSGIVYTPETLTRLADILRQKQREFGREIYLISDEPYREIVFGGKQAPFVTRFYENTLVCYSFSKSQSIPGERLGYVVIPSEAADFDDLMPVLNNTCRLIGYESPATLFQWAIPDIIDDTSDLSVYETNKELLYRNMTQWGYHCVEPGGTFYLFPRSLEPDATAFCRKALKHDLVLVPGDSFGCPGHFRLAFCVPTEKVRRALPRLHSLAREYGRG
ncbi:MAG: pyridoxal phosphate-dependent aminotransferase [Oscillospiraceae bacterium]|nr:pyridoxal phosphate-dependent aminotransferase [Oscillospiraceae bacterium]